MPSSAVAYPCTKMLYLPEGAHVTPPYIGTLTLPPAESYRRTQFLPIKAGPYIATLTPPRFASSRCTQLVPLLVKPIQRFHTTARPHRLRPPIIGATSGCFTREGPLPCPPTTARPRHPRSSSIGIPCWCISRKGPIRHLHTSARVRRLLPSPTGAPR